MHTNGTSRLAYDIAGSRLAFYDLSLSERQEIRDTAKQLFDLGVSFTSADKAEKTETKGFIYILTNPAWPEYVKIGRAFDPDERCRVLQTGTPYRDYFVQYAVYFHDCHWAELELHARLDKWRVDGEWFKLHVMQAIHELNKLRNTL